MRKLQDYLDRIESSIAAGEAVLAQRDPLLTGTVKAKCTEAALLIGSYQMFVHREVFEPLMTSPDDRVRRQVYALKAECIALSEDLRTSVRTLVARETPMDQDAIQARVEWFNVRVRRHIAGVLLLLDSPGGALRRAA
ncbi:hypothetical protein ASG11_00530 [Sphingomonas sp. Leaf357]|uniref:hypothetical protein n=1 Tax=Sphingomonas sp. Leaf357 TaxID=1736350 RepID=UPI0006FAC81F|nr:hypothetical protein [Sphingomonas sp. Leaf357]KQS02948.1 hypothetical protein ASG11_00530 [Sphingomonas sp. Leaf357]